MTDDLQWTTVEPRPPSAPPRSCRRHVWRYDETLAAETCWRCGRVRDPATSRRGRNNRSRGLSVQREVASLLEMKHIPGNGPADAVDDTFYAEIKSGPAWYSLRVEAELDNLPPSRRPMFVAASTPGPGHGRRRVYVTVTLGELIRMVGPHAQVSMWAPEWVALKRETVDAK